MERRDTATGPVYVSADADMKGTEGSSALERLVGQIRSGEQKLDWRGWRGNIALDDSLACHPTGGYPLYYEYHGNGLSHSDRIADLSEDGEPDWCGCVEFLLFGHPVNGRTFFKGVHRVRPGEIVNYDPTIGDVRTADSSPLWRPSEGTNPDDVLDSVWSSLHGIMTHLSGPESAVMMSGGWDSRTLLAGVVPDSPTRLFSHGDPESRELSIVTKLGRKHGCSVSFREIGAQDYSVEQLAEYFAHAGTAMFPHWYQSGRWLREAGSSVAVSGVFGEILGGHYGTSMASHGMAKILAVLRQLCGVRKTPSMEQVRSLLGVTAASTKPWYLTEEFWMSQRWEDQVAGDIDSALTRLQRRGIEDSERLVEAFITEHRGAQYIAQQPRSLGENIGTVDPFSEVSILAPVCSLPLEQRIHNSLNRRLLQRFAPHLLEIPTAAIRVGAGRPILLQEASRFSRKADEMVRQRLGLSTQRTSWVNYDFIRRKGVLDDIVDSLRLPIWDYSELRRRVAKLREGEGAPHPMADMLMKIVTVDRTLSRSGPIERGE